MLLKLPSSEQILFVANILADRLFFQQKYDAKVKKILIVKWDEIGDMAAATHVFQLVRDSYPQAHITLLCKPFVKSLVEHDPNISEIIADFSLFNKSYDLVIELRGTWATLFKSVVYKTKYRVSRAEIRAKNKGHQLHEYDTNSAIIQPILKDSINNGFPKLYYNATDLQIVESFLSENKVCKFVIMHVGARRVLRQWPLERFAFVADFLNKQYQLKIVFAGTVDDEVQINKLRSMLNFETFCFTDGYSLSQFSALCQKATLYIGNESGPLQIAAVFKIPLIGIFGPGVPNVFYPKNANSKILHHVLKCNPCNQLDCVEPQNPCINRVSALDAVDAIKILLD